MLNDLVNQKIAALTTWKFLIFVGIWTLVIYTVVLFIAKLLKVFDVDEKVINMVRRVGRVAFARFPEEIVENYQAAGSEGVAQPQAASCEEVYSTFQ